ncbi:MAG TPA: hypothetical protein VG478_15555 [Acidimicrobiales bacterium]|nr:hypothetical protein [Acidimicrobiales bacterium]
MSVGGRGSPGELAAADELRHQPDAAVPDWQETWWFDAWTPDATVAVTCRVTLLPSRRRAAYWSQLVRAGEPLVHLADLDVPLPSAGLALRSPALWADHECEAPFEQWTVANEAYAVALTDPEEALGRAYGEALPLAVDVEWYATSPPRPTPGGYVQDGEGHSVIELGHDSITLEGPAARGHVWGAARRGPPPADLPDGLRAPLPLPDGTVLDQVVTLDGWLRWPRPF